MVKIFDTWFSRKPKIQITKKDTKVGFPERGDGKRNEQNFAAF